MLRQILVGIVLLTVFSLQAHAESIEDFTQEMEKRSGFYDFYYQEKTGKLYLAVSDFSAPFIFQSSLPQGVGSNDIGLDRGQLGQTRLAQFERFGKKVLLKQLNTQYRALSDNIAEVRSIDEAFADSVIAGLTIVAEDEQQVLVDYTDFLLSDIHQIKNRLSQRNQGNFKADKSRSGVYLPRSKAFVDNTELEALVTFGGTSPGQYVRQVTPDPISISVHLHHSFIRLPDDDYQTRKFHPYSGFWSVNYEDYSVPIEDELTQRLIPRHRLKKKNPQANYSEAVEPIVYYLDAGTPEPVKSALKEGALWWNRAYEQIGYTNAFQVKDMPADADPMDVRYNVIQWVHRATRGWSYGSSIIDPRTGEIIKGHVTLGSLRVRQDYLIALGLTSPFTQDGASTEAQKEMALARIRQLSAHEVGHTLGIAHNFAASQNNRASVMDYPHPYVSIQNGKITLDDAYDVGIGVWDSHVIAYGYQDYPSLSEEQNGLAATIEQGRRAGLKYISDADARPAHAASANGHLWDNGEDAIEELERVMQVRALAIKNFGENSLASGKVLSGLEESFVPIYLFHRYQAEAVGKLIGGVTYEYESKGDYTTPKGVVAVSAGEQLKAFEVLLSTLSSDFLAIPSTLQDIIVPKPIGYSRNRESFNGRTGYTFDAISAAESSAGFSLSLMLNPQRLNRVSQQQVSDSRKASVSDLVSRLLLKTVKASIPNSVSLIDQRVNALVVNQLIQLVDNATLAPEVKAEIQYQLIALQAWAEESGSTPAHKVLAQQLKVYLESGNWPFAISVKPLPPGSPI
jgi:hypothetical protein